MGGVGGYDSWGQRPERERCLWSDRSYAYSYLLVPGSHGEKAQEYAYE